MSYNCPNYCLKEEVNFTDLVKHMKSGSWNGYSYGDKKIKEFEERVESIKKSGKWIDVTDDKITLLADWDTHNAKWLIWLYLADLDGYIWYGCTALCWKDHWEDYDKSVGYQSGGTYHPYGFRIWVHCQRYGMVKLDRFPETYDEIFKFKIPKCSNDCGKPPLYFQQMFQHEKVCQKEVSKDQDPIPVNKLPFFDPNGLKVQLVNPEKFNSFYNSDIEISEEVKLNITLGEGFKVWLMQNTNHIMIVGGLGSEYSTYIFNPETNLIEETAWRLKYPRIGHSLWSANNYLIWTGSKVQGRSEVERFGNKCEVFRLDWDEWREGVELYHERFDHISIVLNNKVFVFFGNDTLNPDSAQDGAEQINLRQINDENAWWRYPDCMNRASHRVLPTLGFLPSPFSERIILFAHK